MSLPPRIPRTVKSSAPRQREGDSSSYRKWVRGLGCVICRADAEFHHLLRTEQGHKGWGQKNQDQFGIPLCARHHRDVHLGSVRPDDAGLGRDENWLAEQYKIDARGLCRSLWAVFNNEDDKVVRDMKGLRLVERARQ